MTLMVQFFFNTNFVSTPQQLHSNNLNTSNANQTKGHKKVEQMRQKSKDRRKWNFYILGHFIAHTITDA